MSTGWGSSNPVQSGFGLPPVQADQLSVPTSLTPPNLGVVGLKGAVVDVPPDGVALEDMGTLADVPLVVVPVPPVPDVALAAVPRAVLCDGKGMLPGALPLHWVAWLL